MSISRETIISALVTLIAGAYPWATGPSRRLKLWADVPPSARPACFVFQGGMEHHAYGAQLVNPKRTIEVRLFIYANAKDPNTIGASLLNAILDALDAAFAAARDPVSGLISLGGYTFSARIEGDALMDPGDLDGDALLIVPVKIVLP
jgi:hypothetical protein